MFCEFAVCVVLGTILLQFLMALRPEDYTEMKSNNKRQPKDYAVEKTVETMKVLEVLEVEPVSIETIIERVDLIPSLNRKLKADAVRRILITLKLLGYAECVEKKWRKGFRQV